MSNTAILKASALAAAMAGLLLSGACTPRTEWYRESAGGAAELRLDREACLKESGDAGFVLGRAGGDPETDARDRRMSSGQGDLYRLCMQSHGWQRRSVKPGS